MVSPSRQIVEAPPCPPPSEELNGAAALALNSELAFGVPSGFQDGRGPRILVCPETGLARLFERDLVNRWGNLLIDRVVFSGANRIVYADAPLERLKQTQIGGKPALVVLPVQGAPGMALTVIERMPSPSQPGVALVVAQTSFDSGPVEGLVAEILTLWGIK